MNNICGILGDEMNGIPNEILSEHLVCFLYKILIIIYYLYTFLYIK